MFWLKPFLLYNLPQGTTATFVLMKCEQTEFWSDCFIEETQMGKGQV